MEYNFFSNVSAPVCLDGQLRCPGGNCAIVCDGKLECKKGEDERNCKDGESGL